MSGMRVVAIAARSLAQELVALLELALFSSGGGDCLLPTLLLTR